MKAEVDIRNEQVRVLLAISNIGRYVNIYIDNADSVQIGLALRNCAQLRRLCLYHLKTKQVNILRRIFASPNISIQNLQLEHRYAFTDGDLITIARSMENLKKVICTIDLEESFGKSAITPLHASVRRNPALQQVHLKLNNFFGAVCENGYWEPNKAGEAFLKN